MGKSCLLLVAFGVLLNASPAQAAPKEAQPKEAASKELTGPQLESMADTQLAGGNKAEALATWKKAMEMQPDPGTRIRYAYFLSQAGEVEQGIATMRVAVASLSNSPSLRYWIADAYARMGKNVEAAAELRGMLADFPGEKPEIERRLGLLKPKAQRASAPVEKEAFAPVEKEAGE